MNKTTRNLFSLVLAMVLVTVSTLPVQAQDGVGTGDAGTADWSNFFDANGDLQSGVTDAGEIEVVAPWMSTVGTDGSYQNNPTYHQYVAANGDTILAPSHSTMITMIANAGESGILDVAGTFQSYGRGNYTEVLDALADNSELRELFLTSAQNGGGGFYGGNSTGMSTDTFFSFQKIVGRLFGTGVQDHALPFSYLYYTASNCDKSPVGCQNVCQVNPGACGEAVTLDDIVNNIPAPSCPASTIVPGTPSLNIIKTGPNSPLVVGQDPDKRGVDVSFFVSIPPTVYTYYIQKPIYEDKQICLGSEVGETVTGANCKTGSSTKNNGKTVNISVLVRIDCEQHVLVYAEPISGVNASANLSNGSADWINNNLSQYYYGAHTLQTSFSLVPGLGSANVGCDGSKTCKGSGAIANIQVRDPGDYGLSFSVTTAGTPVTSGRILRASNGFSVSFIAVRLIENGSN